MLLWKEKNHNYSYLVLVPTLHRDLIRMALRKVSIPTLRNQVGILTLRRAILEWIRFLLCEEHIHQTGEGSK